MKCPVKGANRDTRAVSGILIGYGRVSTDEQDPTAQRDALTTLDVAPERIYVDHGLTETNRSGAYGASDIK